MRKFEVGKRYKDGVMTFEVVSRTYKTIKFVMIRHEGKSNESRGFEKKAKINNWGDREVFFSNCYQVEA